MWSMLVNGTREKGRDAWRLQYEVLADDRARWQAWYRFGATGRLVHNVIDARFRFAPDGTFLEHVDDFDFWRWSRQALGAPGWLLGWTPALRKKVRATAAGRLQAALAG